MTQRAKYLLCGAIAGATSYGAHVLLSNGSGRLVLYVSLYGGAVAATGFIIAAIRAYVAGDDR